MRFVKRRKKEEEQGLQENKYPGARVVAAFSLAGCGSAGGGLRCLRFRG